MHVFERRAMGSPLRLQVADGAASHAERVWRVVSDDVERSEAALSRFRDDSDLTRLNRAAGHGWHEAGPRLDAMLGTAWRAQRLTGGRFDARVLGRLEALGEHGARVTSRSDDGFGGSGSWLRRDARSRRVWIADPVDSGGIGKGLALRWALAAVRAPGSAPTGLLIEAGGDIVVRGKTPDGPWRIGIEDPAGGSTPLAVVEMRDGAMATSSVAVRHWVGPDGLPVHHLLDPATGHPGGGGLQAVTVRWADPAWAEVWSKALFLAGPARIGPEARARGLAAWWIEADGSLHMTPAGRAATIWVRDEGYTVPLAGAG